MTEVWLAIIAVAVAVMAAIRIGAVVLGLRLARRVDQLTTQVERDVEPLIQNLTSVAAEAQRAMQLATAQVERANRLFANLAVSAERTIAIASQFVGGPARGGFAVFTAARAAFSAFREMRETRRRRRGASAAGGRGRRGTRSSSVDSFGAARAPGGGTACVEHFTTPESSRRAWSTVLMMAAPASAQDSKSSAGASELATVMAGKKLDAIAAKDPDSPEGFVAALFFPGQLIVVDGEVLGAAAAQRTAGPAGISRRLHRTEQLLRPPESRIFITDIGADGLQAQALPSGARPVRYPRGRREANQVRRQLARGPDVGGRTLT